MAKDKKTVANAAGNGVTASKIVAGAAEQVKVFEAVIQCRSMDDIKGNSHNAHTHTYGRLDDTAHQQLACMASEFVSIVQSDVGLTVGQ